MSKKARFTVLSTLVIALIGMAVAIFHIQKAASLPDYGTTIDIHGNMTNPEAESAFVKAYLQGNSGRWKKVIYTIEGDPIIYTVRYRNQPVSLEVTIDARRDKFGSRHIKTYTCQKMTAGDELRLTGCTGASSGEIVIP